MTDKNSASPEPRAASFLGTNCAGLTVAGVPLGRRHADAAHPGDVRRALGVAVLACAVLVTGLLAAGSATAQDITTPTANRDGSDTLWSATLTVEDFTISGTQYLGYDRSDSKGSLASDSFTVGSTNYPIYQLFTAQDATPSVPTTLK